ncbi:hypothetical protein DERP_010684 [Dermatophagoides pteronyssinus]|uniref:Uncharacterized protein n=1 Tax=Dermatophagoides pteronyssinus TaxID=6956 RepID=A0ABQ8JAR5_DERPT|nr:hypothetical protein DERP_010684 [Dermatophagoides pteronyssinus]
MSFVYINYSTLITMFVIILLRINHSISNFVDQQSTNNNNIHNQQIKYVPHVDWNFLERLNQTSAKLILQNEIENLKRLFPFNNNNNNNFHNNKSFDSFINHRMKSASTGKIIPQQQASNSNEKLIDKNAILFLGLMLFILVIITLYLLNSWSLRLDRRASIQTKTADNHKQPYMISV